MLINEHCALCIVHKDLERLLCLVCNDSRHKERNKVKNIVLNTGDRKQYLADCRQVTVTRRKSLHNLVPRVPEKYQVVVTQTQRKVPKRSFTDSRTRRRAWSHNVAGTTIQSA